MASGEQVVSRMDDEGNRQTALVVQGLLPDGGDTGLRLTLRRVLSFADGWVWAARIEQRSRGTKHKPTGCAQLLARNGETLGDVFRQLADFCDGELVDDWETAKSHLTELLH